MKTAEIPKDGLEGLKQHWSTDALSGFLVFLLALPLSLGIAKASGFPAAMGVLTAMVGGIIVSLFAGSALTIKGPAAGLITISAGAVAELGALNLTDASGVQLACGAIVVMSILQIGLGFLKLGSLSDFFPPSVVHGMLAAIGLIIFSKQIHVLFGIDPALLRDLNTLDLYALIPYSLANADKRVTLVGVVSLLIIFGFPLIKSKYLNKVPPAMVVILVTIPMALIMDFRHTEPAFDLVSIGSFWGSVSFSTSFAAVNTWVFWKYVVMFLMINSLETVLTVKAIDGLDPFKRESNVNKDLSAVGVGNALSGLLGGLPMISEVARSSANITFGGKTRWANFFHGVFLLIAMLLFIPVIEMIPNAALAALLISVGYKLASPREFFKTYKIGVEQLAVFVITIVATVATDLLIGVAIGILAKLFFIVLNGASLGSILKPRYEIAKNDDEYYISVKESAVFSNLIGFKKLFKSLDPSKKVTINFAEARIVDHSFMEQLHHFEESYQQKNGSVAIQGFEYFQSMSNHPLASRKFSSSFQTKMEVKLSARQIDLRKYAEGEDLAYFPQRTKVGRKYKLFPIEYGKQISFEENLLLQYTEEGKIEVSDIICTEGVRQEKNDVHITVLQITEHDLTVPDFALEPEGLWTKLFEGIAGKDIDFSAYPNFSKKYYLRGDNESAITYFFNRQLMKFLEESIEMHVECHKNRLLFYKKKRTLSPQEIGELKNFAIEFLSNAKQ